ncbi:MAG: AAA family ATPase [Pseudomonas sp.]|nr:AAA family ATPase [Pseudomonas sp.]
MNLIELKDKINAHLTAGYPGLYIQSSEEARVDAMLRDVAAQLQLHPKEWNLGYGWVDFFNKQPLGSQGLDTELASSLPALLDDDLTGKLLIIKDAKSALENQPLAVARLKQLLNRIQRHHRGNAAVILVSETLFIPPAIESQITLLPLPLPRGEEISTQIDTVCQYVGLLVPEALRQRLNAACSGLSQEEIQLALAMVRQQHEQVNDAALALIQHEKEQIIAKSGVLEMIKVSENAADIGGLENLKHWLGRRSQIFRRLGEATQSRVQAPKGVLIAGMPGCGKSLTAKAAAALFQLPLLRLDIGSLLGKYVGESEHNMRRALTMAESVSPCILWIDELEKAFVGMSSGSGSEVSSRLFGYFLTWMQEKTGAVFVIATANNITALPPELLRKGRFDEVFYVGFPNGMERGAILDIHLKDDGLELNAGQRKVLVTQCRDFAGADIQNAINEARESAFLDNRKLTFDDIEAAIDHTVPLRETLREQVGKYEELFEKLKLKPASTFEGLSVAQMIKLSEDPNAIRRKTVANDPDCPDDLLEKLAEDPVLEIRTAVYQNPNCPERLLTLRINIEEGDAKFDLALLHLACTHAKAPHDLLASQFARLKLDAGHRRLLAGKSNHEPLHRLLLGDEDVDVRRLLAVNRALSDETQRLLAKDTVVAVRVALADMSGLSVDVQAILARDQSFQVREVIAGLDDVDEGVQLSLSRDEDLDVRERLAGRKGGAHLPDTVQLQLVKDCQEIRHALAQNPSLGAPAQLLLAQDPQVKVREALAGHPSLATATVQYLLKDTETVQAALAGNRHLSSALLQASLSQSDSNDVRKALAQNPQVNVKVQARLASDPCDDVREALAGNNHCDVGLIETLMRDTAAGVRERLVRERDRVQPAVQRHLARDAELDVRQYLAGAKDLLEDVQQVLAEDAPEVQDALANNGCITAATQQRLFTKGRLELRRNLACNLACAGSVQAMLADDGTVDVRVDLAGNDQLAALVADTLLNDIDVVRVELAGNRSLSEAQYAQLFNAGSDDVRVALARNPAIGDALMLQLSQAKSTQAAGPSSTTATVPSGGVHGWSFGMTGSFATVAARAANPKAARQAPAPAPVPTSSVQLELARNAKLPAELQQRFIANSIASTELMEALASNGSLTPSVQLELASHKRISVRKMLAGNGALADEVRTRLLDDQAAAVRAALVREMDDDVEQRLSQDPTVEVRLALASSSNLSKKTQLILAQDSEKEVRARLLSDEAGPLKSAAQVILAKDADVGIRQQLAVYTKLSPAAQMMLANDGSIAVRKALAAQQAIHSVAH